MVENYREFLRICYNDKVLQVAIPLESFVYGFSDFVKLTLHECENKLPIQDFEKFFCYEDLEKAKSQDGTLPYLTNNLKKYFQQIYSLGNMENWQFDLAFQCALYICGRQIERPDIYFTHFLTLLSDYGYEKYGKIEDYLTKVFDFLNEYDEALIWKTQPELINRFKEYYKQQTYVEGHGEKL